VARILIVDDEPDILLMLRVNLESEGYEAAMAADGETALERARAEPFDLVLLDVMMPVMDGWGVLEGLSRMTDPPRVVVVSAKSSDKDVDRALDAGALDYLLKPFSPRHLVQVVRDVLALPDADVESYRKQRRAGAGR
jgi:DNA-binding response OmpR family regulator